MFFIGGQTAGPNGLKFFRKPMGYQEGGGLTVT